MNTQTILASELSEGDFLVGLGNGYVFEVEDGNGHLSYPSTGYGVNVRMPEDTILVSFHDEDGQENYLLLTPNVPVTVGRMD